MQRQSTIMIFLVALLWAGAICGGSARPQINPTLHSIDCYHLLHDHFAISRTVDQIPRSVQREMASRHPMSASDETAFRQGKRTFRMANPGVLYQDTDYIQEPGLSWSQLVFVAVSKQYCLVESKTGGYAPYQSAKLYRYSQGSATLVWESYDKSKSFRGLRHRIAMRVPAEP